ncbi:MAG: MFS transporter [Bacteroidales bacterium]|nr:MFS transporter [Bacteroidales bacterium]
MKKFFPLYITNLFGVMNDNVLKTLVCFIAASWVNEEYRSIVVNATAGALVLPYLLFSPLAGKLPQLYSKLQVFRWCKILELPIMLIAILGFYYENIWIAISAVLLMGLQSAIYSPSKYGLIKDIGGTEGISTGMGGMEAIAFLGMLLGTVAASFLAELPNNNISFIVLIALATLGLIASTTIHADEKHSTIKTSTNPIKFLRDTSHLIGQYRGLHHVIHLLSLFWWLSASLQTILIIYCTSDMGLTPSETGYILALTAIGITAGCLVGGQLDHKLFMLGYVPQLGMLDAILLLAIFFAEPSPVIFAILVASVAFIGGLFKIPLDAEIQKRVSHKELNVVLAYFNLVSFIYIFMASATNIIVTSFFPNRYVFLAIAIVIGVSSIIFIFDYKAVLCFFGREHIRLHYDIDNTGRNNLDTVEGENLLILPQHVAVIDPLMLFAELYDKKIQPLVDEDYFHIPVIGHVLSLFNAVEVPDLRRSRKGLDKVKQLDSIILNSLNKGDNILFYPSGHITTDGVETIGSRHLAYNTVINLPENTKVIGIRIRGLWGSQWSRYGLNATPSIVSLLAKSALLIFSTSIFWMKKRKVTLEYVDITDKVKTWRQGTKLEFNAQLENFYNS